MLAVTALVAGSHGVAYAAPTQERSTYANDNRTRSNETIGDKKRQLRKDIRTIEDLGVVGVLADAHAGHRRITARAGVADRRSGRPVPYRAAFRGGSNIKTYVATVVLQLVGEGLLALGDTVEDWLPGVVRGNGNDGSRITVRHLLQHTSGLYDYVADVLPGSAAELRERRFDRYRPRDLVEIAMRHRPEFQPGDTNPDGSPKWSYSNTGYVLLGMIIKKATGKSWRRNIVERIVEPLKLRGTSFPRNRTKLPHPFMRGYVQYDSAELTDSTRYNLSAADAAGGMVTTTRDMNRFFRALLTGKLLSPDLLETMQQTVPTHWGGAFEGSRYGLGIFWYPLPCNDAGYWAHGGTFVGYLSRHGMTADGRNSVTVAMSTELSGAAGEQQEAAAAATIHRFLC